ncbi:MAG: tRNA methyltransferase [Thermoproteota archaeon]|nr:MAG: tRNA methyltransferase [Candidatus Korarchaeota archaeon]
MEAIPPGILKPSFERRYRELLGPDYEDFLRFTSMKPRRAVRINPMKVDPDRLISRLEGRGWRLERIPWYEHGYWVVEGPEKLGSTVEHQLGLYYVQEAASMIPPVALSPEPGESVADVAAAPGSKTTQMSEMMRWRGLILANDPDLARFSALSSNVQRMGCVNVSLTSLDGRVLPRIFGEERFDRVLLDAPCSSVGEARRDWGALKRWSLRRVRRLARLQEELAISAYRLLKPGGLMVYSTCTLDPEENEFVVLSLIRRGAEVLRPRVEGLLFRPGLTRWAGRELDPSLARTMRVLPQDNDTMAFFVALIRKPEGGS